MATFKTIDTIRKENLSGTYEYCLMKTDEDTWKVMCFEVQDDPREGEILEILEFQWEVFGNVIGYRDNNPNLEIREYFTEETARAEFERWR